MDAVERGKRHLIMTVRGKMREARESCITKGGTIGSKCGAGERQVHKLSSRGHG